MVLGCSTIVAGWSLGSMGSLGGSVQFKTLDASQGFGSRHAQAPTRATVVVCGVCCSFRGFAAAVFELQLATKVVGLHFRSLKVGEDTKQNVMRSSRMGTMPWERRDNSALNL